jgi:hypothetical protein
MCLQERACNNRVGRVNCQYTISYAEAHRAGTYRNKCASSGRAFESVVLTGLFVPAYVYSFAEMV